MVCVFQGGGEQQKRWLERVVELEGQLSHTEAQYQRELARLQAQVRGQADTVSYNSLPAYISPLTVPPRACQTTGSSKGPAAGTGRHCEL